MRQVRSQMVVLIDVAHAENLDRACKLLSDQGIVDSVAVDKGRIRITLKPNVDEYYELASQLIQEKIAIKHFGEEEINLESAFMALTKGPEPRSSLTLFDQTANTQYWLLRVCVLPTRALRIFKSIA